MVKCIERVDLWNAGYVELWDFRRANSSQEAREEACAIVSEVCRGKKISNPQKHYQRLLTEHGGRPSEIFSFLPFATDVKSLLASDRFAYRETVGDDVMFTSNFYYTNLRNVIPKFIDGRSSFVQNTSGFVVFKIKVPYMIVDSLRRHKLLPMMIAENWQSNRSTHEIEYFKNDEIKALKDLHINNFVIGGMSCYKPLETLLLHAIKNPVSSSKGCRPELINKGEFGLRYTTGFLGGWINDPLAWDNFFSVRALKPTQKETIQLATEMQKLIDKHL
jgi:hypothetical protein